MFYPLTHKPDNMKELNDKGKLPIIKTHYPVKERPPMKRWVIAMTNSSHKQKKDCNKCVEAAYMRIVDAVKKLYLTPGTVYFEKDYRQDRQSAMAMHTLLTPDFYIHLQCSFFYDYEVEYAFGNCSYEQIMRQLLKVYPLDSAARQFEPQDSFNTFYNTVLSIQDASHIHTL